MSFFTFLWKRRWRRSMINREQGQTHTKLCADDDGIQTTDIPIHHNIYEVSKVSLFIRTRRKKTLFTAYIPCMHAPSLYPLLLWSKKYSGLAWRNSLAWQPARKVWGISAIYIIEELNCIYIYMFLNDVLYSINLMAQRRKHSFVYYGLIINGRLIYIINEVIGNLVN